MIKLWLSILAVLSLLPAGRADSPPSRELVLSLLERHARAWETGDEKLLLEVLHPDVVFAYPGKRLDLDGILLSFRAWKRDFKNTKMIVHASLVEGAKFSMEYLFIANNAATGAQLASGTVAVGEVKEGRLYIVKEYLDGRVSRMQQKGELPADTQAEPFPWPDTPASRQP